MGVARLVHHKYDEDNERKNRDGQGAHVPTHSRAGKPQERLDEQGHDHSHDARGNIDHSQHLNPREEAERRGHTDDEGGHIGKHHAAEILGYEVGAQCRRDDEHRRHRHENARGKCRLVASKRDKRQDQHEAACKRHAHKRREHQARRHWIQEVNDVLPPCQKEAKPHRDKDVHLPRQFLDHSRPPASVEYRAINWKLYRRRFFI